MYITSGIIITTIFTYVIIQSQYLENKLLYHPKKLDKKYKFMLCQTLGQYNKEYNKEYYKEYNLKTKNSVINFIYYKNINTPNFVIFAHGNGGNISSCNHIFHIFQNNASVIAFDYSGYGKSTGTPTESQLYKDAYNMYMYVIKKLKINPKYITLYGFSLGASVMAQLGSRLCNTEFKPHSIILEAGFCSLKHTVTDILNDKIAYLVKSKFDTLKYVKNIKNKIKILACHSDEDELIKYYHKDLIKEANNNIIFYKTYGGHNDLVRNKEYIDILYTMLYTV